LVFCYGQARLFMGNAYFPINSLACLFLDQLKIKAICCLKHSTTASGGTAL
jgi:hypothetical protein